MLDAGVARPLGRPKVKVIPAFILFKDRDKPRAQGKLTSIGIKSPYGSYFYGGLLRKFLLVDGEAALPKEVSSCKLISKDLSHEDSSKILAHNFRYVIIYVPRAE